MSSKRAAEIAGANSHHVHHKHDGRHHPSPHLAHLDEDEHEFQPSHSTMHGKVLILNGNYEPLAISSVEKAIVLLYLDKAELVSSLTNRAVHSTSMTMPFPSVIRLAQYVRVPFKKVILSRKNILRRDGHKCQYCGLSGVTLTVDHIMPKSRGGEDSWENLVSACLRCNNVKGSQTPDEAQMALLRRPIRPNHVTFLRQFIGRIDKDWEPYLFMH
jgi:5-methylcytosine-specific restriction endonuclease McrA